MFSKVSLMNVGESHLKNIKLWFKKIIHVDRSISEDMALPHSF